MSEQDREPTLSDDVRAIALRNFPDKDTPYGNAQSGAKLILFEAADRLETLEGLLRWFCERVEKGEIISHATYPAFKEALGEEPHEILVNYQGPFFREE